MAKSRKNIDVSTGNSLNQAPVIVKSGKKPGVIVQQSSKQDHMIALLKHPQGSTIEELAKVTGWQKHSVRGMISGVLKKRLGLSITSGTEERGRVYRIIGSVSRS
jgi:hypothetical protein